MDSYTKRAAKTRHNEQLVERRGKLKNLLDVELENYKRELDDKKHTRRQSQESTCTLEDLRKKLLEKKAEESLYYPSQSRRLRSYEFSPAQTAKQLESLAIGDDSDNVDGDATGGQQGGYSTSANVIGGTSVISPNESPNHEIKQKHDHFTSGNVIGERFDDPNCEEQCDVVPPTEYTTSANVIGGKAVGMHNESPSHEIKQKKNYFTSANVIGGKSDGPHCEQVHEIVPRTGYSTSANVIGGKSVGPHNESPIHEIEQQSNYFTSANVIGGKSDGFHSEHPMHEIVQRTGYSTSANIIGGKPMASSASLNPSRYSPTRYTRNTLQNTNLCSEDAVDQANKEISDSDANDQDCQNIKESDVQVIREKRSVNDLESNENYEQRRMSLTENQSVSHIDENQTSHRDDFGVNYYRRGNMQQKKADFGDTDMSVQMYRYMKHTDLKHKISDLWKREQLFITKQRWDEALRLREMRNELILLKNKNLYENHDLKIDEEIRKAGQDVIKAREELKEKRAKMSDSLMYSDEAKDLWNRWVKEDRALEDTESSAMRDLLLNELEEEWKNLALIDKNRISQLYDRVINKSDLQEEHHLISIIEKANSGQKQYMNYLVN